MAAATAVKDGGNAIAKSPTGIEGFDQITYGGLPAQRTTLVIGGPGAGKTVFALQALVNGAREHHEPAIFVAFEESASQIVQNAATFGWNLEDLERDRLFFLDARISPATVKSGEFDLEGILAGLTAKVQEMSAKRIVFDGLDVLLTLLDDEAAERREAYRLHEWLKSVGATGIITAKSDQRDRLLSERYGFMQFMVDCVVGLQHKMVDRVSLRSVRVLKYRGSAFDEGEFPLVIGVDGVEIATFNTSQIQFDVSTERVSTGLPRLDTMMGGGYYRGSSVIITGVPGTSKTTLASAFAAGMCARDERVLYVSFDESGGQMVRNLRSVGIDLQSCIDRDLLKIHAIRTEARSAEEHFMEVKRLLGDFQPQHLVLDPVSALMKTGGQVSAVHAAFRLLDYAKCRGITVVCTSLITTNEMPEVATTMDISTIADTWIHLSYKVLGGERNRTLSIVKSRGMGHSNQVRELVLDDSGPSLRDVYTAGGEVLVGTARYEKEAENELRRRRRQLEADLKRSQLEAMESSITVRIEALQQELAAKRREIDFFEAESGAVSRADEENEVSVRRLRSADVTGMGA
jgi:circadian clock protein KaiC